MGEKLTKAQRAFLRIAEAFGGECRVFQDQWTTASVLAARGLITVEGIIQRTATLTPAGRAALDAGEPGR